MSHPALPLQQRHHPELPYWEIRATEEIYSNGYFRLRRDECYLTRAPLVSANLYVLEMPDVVSVVPVTPEGKLVLVEQYRHGVDRWLLECPGGALSAGDPRPLDTARRELREETGYDAQEFVSLGAHYPNPSGQTNRIHTFLAKGCVRVAEPDLERFEHLRVRLVDRQELMSLVQSGAPMQTGTLASVLLATAMLDIAAP
ncbi:MAG: NUDIX hydrolase [Gammaproteobacteria bacterium]|nr:NUDIX hydrolase [Gammaproteobacteria bacterium]